MLLANTCSYYRIPAVTCSSNPQPNLREYTMARNVNLNITESYALRLLGSVLDFGKWFLNPEPIQPEDVHGMIVARPAFTNLSARIAAVIAPLVLVLCGWQYFRSSQYTQLAMPVLAQGEYVEVTRRACYTILANQVATFQTSLAPFAKISSVKRARFTGTNFQSGLRSVSVETIEKRFENFGPPLMIAIEGDSGTERVCFGP